MILQHLSTCDLVCRTFLVLDNGVTLHDPSLASKTLDQAFREYLEKAEGEGKPIQLKQWLVKSAASIEMQHSTLTKAIEGLQRFSDKAPHAR